MKTDKFSKDSECVDCGRFFRGTWTGICPKCGGMTIVVEDEREQKKEKRKRDDRVHRGSDL